MATRTDVVAPKNWTRYQKLVLRRHLKVAIDDYDWALRTNRLDPQLRREVEEAKAEAEAIIALLS